MHKPIFNSLGSNYSLAKSLFFLKELLFANSKKNEELIAFFNKKFGGQTILLYKGRDAIEYILRAFGVTENDEVITQAFTCHAIEEAIHRVGAKPLFCDLGSHSLNPTVGTLRQVLRRSKNAKVVIIQHTLGFTADIKAIRKWCDEEKLLLIEDLASSFGALDAEGVEVGTYGDAVMLSFGRDKILDAVSGGAAVIKNAQFLENLSKINVESKLPSKVFIVDHLYPIWTWLVRNTHQFLLGKILFKIGKQIGVLTSPIESPTKHMVTLPAGYAAAVLGDLQELSKQLSHRRQIARIYTQSIAASHKLQEELVSPEITNQENNCFLRYPLLARDPDHISYLLTKKKIYLTDRWYRKAVDFGSLKRKTVYKAGTCPRAEFLAEHVFNLPTHRGINEMSAKYIISEFLHTRP